MRPGQRRLGGKRLMAALDGGIHVSELMKDTREVAMRLCQLKIDRQRGAIRALLGERERGSQGAREALALIAEPRS